MSFVYPRNGSVSVVGFELLPVEIVHFAIDRVIRVDRVNGVNRVNGIDRVDWFIVWLTFLELGISPVVPFGLAILTLSFFFLFTAHIRLFLVLCFDFLITWKALDELIFLPPINFSEAIC